LPGPFLIIRCFLLLSLLLLALPASTYYRGVADSGSPRLLYLEYRVSFNSSVFIYWLNETGGSYVGVELRDLAVKVLLSNESLRLNTTIVGRLVNLTIRGGAAEVAGVASEAYSIELYGSYKVATTGLGGFLLSDGGAAGSTM